MTNLPASIRITEVGPRDGLQNEPKSIEADDKVRFVDLLSRSGVAEIEVSSFVSPRWVPQLGDAAEVFANIERADNVVYSALVPNMKGMERALAAEVDKIAVFTAASETFSERNTNGSIAEVLQRLEPVITEAKGADLPVRGYVSCVVACPFEGPITPAAVLEVATRLLDMGVDEIDLGETIGVAVPSDIDRLFDGIAALLQPSEITLHLHDTRGTALACAYRAMQLGVRSFDGSSGGIGGCPFAPGAAGNLATEDLVYMCEKMEIDCGVNLQSLFAASGHIAALLGRPLTGRVFNADGRSSQSAGSSTVSPTSPHGGLTDAASS